jgi:hypothetical protein
MSVSSDVRMKQYRRSFAAVALCSTSLMPAQKPAVTQASVPALVEYAVKYQLEDFHHTSWALRYRVHHVTDREDTIRELVETPNGNVARTLERHGQRLSPEDAGAEEQRLRSLTPAELERHHKGGDSTDKFAVELMTAMPKAMIYTLAPGQPQLPQFTESQVVLDYAPNPEFHPASTAQSLLLGLSGKLWIDAETHHILRIEINIVKNLNLMMGILAHVYQGGTMVYEQRPIGGGHYAYSHIEIDVRLRELMVKTVPYHSVMDTMNVTLLPSPPPLKQAVDMLLSTP